MTAKSLAFLLSVPCLRTNEKIEEDFIKSAYSAEYLRKAPHIKYTDEVSLSFFCYRYLFRKEN
jgi:hypothetical protein